MNSTSPPTSPLLIVTLGDPAGIGPEVCLKLLAETQGNSNIAVEPCRLIIFGDKTVFEKLIDCPGFEDVAAVYQQLPVVAWEEFRNSPRDSHKTPLLVDMASIAADEIQPGMVTAKQGASAYLYIQRAIEQTVAGYADGIVTAPIHKEALHAAGVPYPGHTEILTEQTGAERSVMMLTAPEITSSLVTAHVGLAEVPGLLSVERISETIELTANAMRKMRGREPRLVVCGLNPHAGEGGLFGEQEEERFIIPAVEKAKARGIQISGPFPPDTAFLARRRKETDAFICMYHDQGLIPLKALAFDDAVNVTLGLPIVRTSVDHGTAFDIAWQGKASVSSMISAVNLACRLCAK
ncbi:4-hydroxythreonine-4-phosphate dehydrogenase PdxA [bacterium]|nr:4-hydroxythreonine-4-phosphate dehydrogenase PdxA [bacterium]